MLSAQTTDVRVNIVTAELFPIANSPEAFDQMELSELEDYIRSIGLYKSKAKNIKATARMLIEDFDSQVPSNKKDLIKLPGVGGKTANVVMANAYDIPAFAVDTHVFRVSNRLGLAGGKNVEITEKQLEKNVPKDKWNIAHRQLITHGRALCKARKPLCDQCKLDKLCLYNRSNND